MTFLDALPSDEAQHLLQQRRTILAAELANAQAIPQHSGSSQLVIEHLVRHLQTELDWLDEVIGRLSLPK